ncbi:hypothetical protein GO684_02610 [Wolbachia endosymbiont of Litomosoides brasiliensis]|uniref:hypothetical protein n=1 Tax=Wolbachia endosymbiont of Litomosoides brasiliensis TaxID=1812117 RepID=UPI00158A0D64|nr:hypothetical protein [Wolbachia endosymbiont of Litomosoides brasiliensis]NUY39563.1 hypothetical protein [Wolbachia endosymbiont of Litomosoides brasiliensis]
MFSLNYLITLEIATIIRSYSKHLNRLVLRWLNQSFTLIIGTIVDGISVVSSIAALITTPPS